MFIIMLMKKDEISFYGMMIILELIPTSRNYLESYIEKFPENQSDAISYSTDTACDCKQKSYAKNTTYFSVSVVTLICLNDHRSLDIRSVSS